MKKKTIVNLVKYGVGSAAVLALAGVFLWQYDFWNQDLVTRYMILSDAFAVPGLFLLMFGVMIWLTNQGALDGVTFCLHYVFSSLMPGRNGQRAESYAQYIERKSGKRTKGYGFLLWIGLASFIIGLVFFILYGFSTDWAWFDQLKA